MRKFITNHPTKIVIVCLLLIPLAAEGVENNLETPPPSFLGYNRFESPIAYIYCDGQEPSSDIITLINEVVKDIKKITDENIAKGIIIQIEPQKRHPIPIFMDVADKIENKDMVADFSKMRKDVSEKGLSIHDAMIMATVPLPYGLFRAIVYSEQQEPNGTLTVTALENFLKTTTENKNEPWVLCVPSKECSVYVGKKVLPKLIKSEMGWGKYLLVKPFMGKIRKQLIEQFTNETKIIMFNVLIDGLAYSDFEKESLIKEYASQFRQDENKNETGKNVEPGVSH